MNDPAKLKEEFVKDVDILKESIESISSDLDEIPPTLDALTEKFNALLNLMVNARIPVENIEAFDEDVKKMTHEDLPKEEETEEDETEKETDENEDEQFYKDFLTFKARLENLKQKEIEEVTEEDINFLGLKWDEFDEESPEGKEELLEWVLGQFSSFNKEQYGAYRQMGEEEDEQGEEEGEQGNGALEIIDFYTEWCAPCKMLGKILTEVEKKFPDVEFLRVDAESEEMKRTKDRFSDLTISSVPTIIFAKGDQVLVKVEGTLSEEMLIEKINELK